MEKVIEELNSQPENIPEKTPFWQNPKIPIVVALVVVGLTILASGWLVWKNQRLKQVPGDDQKITPGKYCEEDSDCGWGTLRSDHYTNTCILGGDEKGAAGDYKCICNKTYIPPKCEMFKISSGVTITTYKTEYEQGEEVKITVRNNSDEAIYFSSCDAYYPEIEKNGAWRRTFRKECEPLSVKDKISSRESKILQECEIGFKDEPLLPWKFYPGNWRIILGYYLGCVDKAPSHCLSHKTIFSNEFRIKGKKPEEECYKDPREALDKFLSYLHGGEYEKAAELYHREVGFGGYPSQRPFPSGATEEERIKIEARGLADFCYGYATCLEHKIVGEKIVSGDEILFIVQFYKESGEVFEFVKPFVDEAGDTYYRNVGPDFDFKVKKINGCYKNMDVPPITP